MGLPCACELQMYINSGQSIPLDAIDLYWQQIYVNFADDDLSETQETSRADTNLITASSASHSMRIPTISEDIESPPVIPKKNKPKWGIRMPSGFEHAMKMVGLKRSGTTKTGKGRVATISESQGSRMSVSQEETGPTPSRMSTGTFDSSPITPTSRLMRSSSTRLPSKPTRRTTGATRDFPQHPSLDGLDLPQYILPYIATCTKINGDGNCGFRAVASAIYDGEHAWPTVRQDLFTHLTDHREFFKRMLGDGEEGVEAMYRRLYYFNSPAPFDNWMTMPDCGHVIASTYNVYVMTFSEIGGMTCPPGFVDPYRGPPQRTIVLGNVEGLTHWVLLNMKDDDFPVPPINAYWPYHRAPSAANLDSPLQDRIEHWIRLNEQERARRDTFATSRKKRLS